MLRLPIVAFRCGSSSPGSISSPARRGRHLRLQPAGRCPAARRFVESRDHPAISYSTGATSDAVSALNARLAQRVGDAEVRRVHGLPPVGARRAERAGRVADAGLLADQFPGVAHPDAQPACGVLQRHGRGRIHPRRRRSSKSPRRIRRRALSSMSSHRMPDAKPAFKRNNECLACHLSWETLGVPGLMVQSVYPLRDENSYANGFTTVHGSPLEQRWGGWWVTGDHGRREAHRQRAGHVQRQGKSKLASPTRALPSLDGLFDLKGYPTPYSDVVALLVHRPSDPHDEPDHAHRMGSAAGRSIAEPGRLDACHRGRTRPRRLPAVCGRGAA